MTTNKLTDNQTIRQSDNQTFKQSNQQTHSASSSTMPVNNTSGTPAPPALGVSGTVEGFLRFDDEAPAGLAAAEGAIEGGAVERSALAASVECDNAAVDASCSSATAA